MSTPNTPPLSHRDKDLKSEIAAGSLADRVRSLKIAKEDRLDNQKSGSRFPWILSLILGVALLWLLYRDDKIMASLGFSRPVVDAKGKPGSPVKSSSGAVASTPDRASSKTTQAASTPSQSPSNTKSSSSNPIALESRGYVIAKHQVLVSPQVSGRIISLNIEEGRRVTKGDVLAEVERTEYQADADQIRKDKDAQIKVINNQLVDAVSELRKRPSRTAETSNGKNCNGASLFAEDAEFLVREAARADEIRVALGACYKQYNSVSK